METLSTDIEFNVIDAMLTPECKDKKIHVDYEFSEPRTPKDIAHLSIYLDGKLKFERGIRMTEQDYVYQIRQRWINVEDLNRFKHIIVDDLFIKHFISGMIENEARKGEKACA